MQKRLISSLQAIIATLFMVFSTNFAATTAAFATQPTDPGNNGSNISTDCPTGPGLTKQGNTCKITICHRDAAASKPYVSETVDLDAADGNSGNDHGQGDHFVEHTGPVFNSSMQQGDTWGDIIPPIPGVHTGLNWITGQAIWNNDCAVPQATSVAPAAVTFHDECGTASDTYTIPSKVGVDYMVSGVVKPASTYAGTGTVTVTAVAQSGYVLTGTTTFTNTFSDAICVHTATPTGVSFHDVCGITNDSYTIPNDVGVNYAANGSIKAAGTYTGSGTVNVTATAAYGYALTGTTSWNHTFTNEDCTPPPTDCPTGPGLTKQGNTCKITICHRDAAASKPYVSETVDLDAADGNSGNDHGQGDHFVEHTGPVFNSSMQQGDTWGDIIPPIPGVHTGLNWITGQAIWNNDCAVPQAPCDVCPNIEGNQSQIPSGYVKDDNGNCIVPGHGGGDDNPTDTTGTQVIEMLTVSKPLAPSTSPVNSQQLVNTGQNVLLDIMVGLALLGSVASVSFASHHRRLYA